MNWRKVVPLFCTLVLIGSLLPLGAMAAIPTQQDILAKVEPLVTQELAAHGQTDYFIWMTEKADLTPAYAFETKLEKGRFVYETLVATAERTQKDLRAYLDRQGANYEAFYIANKILVYGGSYELLLQVAGRPDVVQVTANHPFQLQEPEKLEGTPPHTEAVEPNITFIRVPPVWSVGYTGQGTVMAGNDTGLDETHPTIARHYRGCLNPPTCSSWDHNYNWWDATGTYPTNPYDGHGHGTHTTGTMVGDDGGNNQIGVAPGAQTVHCKNMTDGGSGNDGTFTTCFQWDLAPWDLNHANPRTDLAPDAINNSWGYWGGNQNQFRDEILALQAAGIAVEVSAGNEGPSCATLRSPGDYQEVLTTGSVDHIGQTFPGIITVGSWSTSRGPSDLDGNYFPDIMAPGNGVRSSLPGNSYGSWGGTSMAGPHATALVGLMWSACPAMRGMVDQTYQIIKDTAGPLTGQGGSNCGGDYTNGPNNDWGYGTIDAQAAVAGILAQCSGQGGLDGHVTDAQTNNPIQGAIVTGDRAQGGSWSDTTDANGYYTMTVPQGDYTVSAAHALYTTGVTSTVVVTDEVTTVDFALQRRGRLFGYVTDADNGFPLEGATVTADDGTSANTDSAGFYQMYLDAGTRAVTASLANYVPGSASVVIAAGQDTQQDFALWAEIAFVPMPVHEFVVLNTTHNIAATLTNRRSSAYPFNLYEIPGGFTPGLEAIWPGPDGFGYAGEAVDYDWADIRSSGTPVPGLSDDSYAGPFNIGFTFPFYGGNQTQFYVSSNGHIDFGAGSSSLSNQCPLPNSTTPNNAVYLMWDDLYPNYSTGGVYYQAFPTCPVGAGTCLVVEYYNWNHYGGGTAGTFEAILFENGSVQMQYLDGGSEMGSGSTTGIEGNNAPANHGLTYACDTANSLPDGLSICYIYPDSPGCVAGDVPWLGESPTAGTVPAQGSLGVGVYFTATASVGVTQTGDYYATLVVNGSPKVRVPVTMTVITQPVLPVASFDSSSPVCDGVEVVFTDTSDLGLPPADQFLWDFGDGITSTLENPTHLYGGAGPYTVTFELCNIGGCDTAQEVVQVLAAPSAGFTFVSNQLTVTFTNSSQYATSYLWAFGDGITSTLQNPVHTYAAAGPYTVTLTAYGCGQDEFVAVLEVAELPVAGFSSNSPVCLGLPAVFTNTSTGAESYLWAFGDGGTSTETNPVHLYGAAQAYTVSLEACSVAGCDTATGSVEVLPLPQAGFTFTANLLTVTFSNASQNATSYLWDFGDGITSTLQNPVHTYGSAGTYTVTLTATGDCGTALSTALVTVSALPQAGFSSNSPVCLGLPAVFTNTSTGAESYLWAFGDGLTSTLANPVHNYPAAGNYPVTLEACNGAGCDTASATFEVQPLPQAGFTFAASLLTVTFTNASQNATSYLWDFGDGITSTLQDPVHSYTAAGTYTVTLTATGVCGDNAFSAAVTVSTTPPQWKIYLPLLFKSY